MRIPPVHEVKKRLAELFPDYPESYFTIPARKFTELLRKKWLSNQEVVLSDEDYEALLKKIFIEYETPSLKRVINATGVVIHTNLGRAPLALEAQEAILRVAKYYSNLEYDLKEGRRGSRYSHVEEILLELTGAEAALVVNNNASAVLITLNTLARGKEVIVSRGELVEIGGSFRIPEVMSWAGCTLREVGTTNKTHLKDYENAINENTAMLLKVHKSNFAIVGFTKEVPAKELVELAKRRGLLVMEDLGSGCFVDFSKYGYQKEPTVQEVLKAGVDVVTFSGDKLLGGPQAGIILGKKELIEKIKKNPLNRAIRIDKLTLAALEATLRLYRDEELAVKNIPVLRMILASEEELKKRARKLLNLFKKAGLKEFEFSLVRTMGKTGGGALPLLDLPSFGVSVKCNRLSPSEIQSMLRKVQPPIIVRIEEDQVIFDVRCIYDEELPLLVDAMQRIEEELSGYGS